MALILGALAAGAIGAGIGFFSSNNEQKTLSNVSLNDTQNVYATSILNNLQVCGAIPADQNVVSIIGNFNSATKISQYLSDQSKMVCSFQAQNQQDIQDSLVANLIAKAESNATAPLNASAFFGLFNLGGGSLLNKANVDVSSVQNAVATAINNQIQVCNNSNCSGQYPVTGPPSPGQSQPGTGSCGNVCYAASSCAAESTCTGGANQNLVCIEGNFNNVSNIDQNLNVEWVNDCMYSESATQSINNSISASLNAAANATTIQSFTILGWLCYFFVFILL
jgi:hypothetical protein